MPVIWPSSLKPMYVRTVRVNGFPHAILSEDDPHIPRYPKSRPQSCASARRGNKKTESRLSHRVDLESCLRRLKLDVNVRNDQETFTLNLEGVHDSEEIGTEREPSPRDSSISTEDMRIIKTVRSFQESHETQLSERVLQWLDLAGKVDLLAPEKDAPRLSQPRHSWPNIKKSKTVIDLKAFEKKVPAAREFGSHETFIDRNDVCVPAADTIEQYARQTRHGRTSRNDLAKESKTKVKELGNQETRQRIMKEKEELERQLSQLVTKKVVPDARRGKKQVHIFIPEHLPKKLGK